MVCVTMTKNYLNNHTTKEVIATRSRLLYVCFRHRILVEVRL